MASATYCPEDDKLRLYTGFLPREEYEALRKEGWTCLHKQRDAGGGDFAAVWTPQREDTALRYADEGIIDDEDKGPQDRAADRAERFSEYRDKREGEAISGADRYDNGPQVHGYQSQALAERRAARHDAIATRAVNAWDKAEYWQRRTAGVISHALHVASPGVRMGRVKVIESEIRKIEASREEYRHRHEAWQRVASMDGADVLLPMDECGYADIAKMTQVQKIAYAVANHSSSLCHLPHPDGGEINEHGKRIHRESFHGFSAYDFLTHDTYGGGPFRRLTPREYATYYLANVTPPEEYGRRHLEHLRLRLAYENQMLEAQGGRLAATDIEVGGFVGGKQVYKVNKSPATGRVTSVAVRVPRVEGYAYRVANVKGTDYALFTIDTERLPPGAYRPPTDEERAAFKVGRKEEKDKRGVIPTINPTREDAERLQSQLNAEAAIGDKGKNYPRKPGSVEENTQAQYSSSHKDYRCVQDVNGVCKVRVRIRGWDRVHSVVVLTDKPQKPLPAAVWEKSGKTNGVAA